jgi:hypothetical protein
MCVCVCVCVCVCNVKYLKDSNHQSILQSGLDTETLGKLSRAHSWDGIKYLCIKNACEVARMRVICSMAWTLRPWKIRQEHIAGRRSSDCTRVGHNRRALLLV